LGHPIWSTNPEHRCCFQEGQEVEPCAAQHCILRNRHRLQVTEFHTPKTQSACFTDCAASFQINLTGNHGAPRDCDHARLLCFARRGACALPCSEYTFLAPLFLSFEKQALAAFSLLFLPVAKRCQSLLGYPPIDVFCEQMSIAQLNGWFLVYLILATAFILGLLLSFTGQKQISQKLISVKGVLGDSCPTGYLYAPAGCPIKYVVQAGRPMCCPIADSADIQPPRNP